MSHALDIDIELERSTFRLQARFTAPASGVTAIYGASGAGKTSLLRAIAGLESCRGSISVGSDVWQNDGICLETHQRRVGFVFQEASLFEHLSVRANLEFGQRRNSAVRQALSLERAIELLKLGSLLERKPHQLSGGEQQRVAIGRALLSSPRLLLMDEPLSSLDMEHKRELMNYLEQLHSELQLPILYVTHSADEIARLADHLVLLQEGTCIASGPAAEIMTRLDLPMSDDEEAAAIIVTHCSSYDAEYGLSNLQFSGGILQLPGDHSDTTNQRVRILARDVSLTLHKQSDTSILNIVPVEVMELSPCGTAQCVVRLKSGDDNLLARVTRKSAATLELQAGRKLYAQIKTAALLG